MKLLASDCLMSLFIDAGMIVRLFCRADRQLLASAPAPATTKTTTVGYGRHLLASAPAPSTTKTTLVGYGRHLLAALAPAPATTKATTVGYGRHLLASAPAPASAFAPRSHA